MSKLAVVRVRSGVDARETVRDTLRMLNLTRPNHCVIVEDIPERKGMLRKAKEMVTWGPIGPEVLEELLRERGELTGGDSVTDDVIDEFTSYGGIGEFSEAVCNGKADLDEVEGLNKVFRLRPPKKGYESTRRSFRHGGALGDRGEEIKDLILRMV